MPLLFIALAIAEADDDAIIGPHAVRLVVEEIGWGRRRRRAGVLGAGVLAVGRRRLVADEWMQVIPLAAAGLSYGLAAPLGGSGFIAAFVAGSSSAACSAPATAPSPTSSTLSARARIC